MNTATIEAPPTPEATAHPSVAPAVGEMCTRVVGMVALEPRETDTQGQLFANWPHSNLSYLRVPRDDPALNFPLETRQLKRRRLT
jgi:hypothetical protein